MNLFPVSGRLIYCGGFAIEHPPLPKPRHRARVVQPKGGKAFVSIYPDAEGERDEETIARLAAAWAPRAPLERPLKLEVVAALLVPDSWPAWERRAALAGRIHPTSGRGGRAVGGDVDNFAKQLMDALTRSGRWWKDDAQVVELLARKVYSGVAGWAVRVEEIVEPTREAWLEEERASARRPASPSPRPTRGPSPIAPP